MLLLEICRMIFSPSIKKVTLLYLRDCIDLYLTNFQKLYGLHLIPKQHYLTHYPSLILKCGPLINFWTMRTEAKHKWFKKLVYILGNYKNIPLSLADRHQLHQADVLSGSLLEENQYGPIRKVIVSEAPFANLFPNRDVGIETNWMSIKGMKFEPNTTYIPVGYDKEEDRPVFLFIVNTIAWPELLVCKTVETGEFDCQIGAYPVTLGSELTTCTLDQILGHRVLHAHTVEGRMFTASKVCIGDSF